MDQTGVQKPCELRSPCTVPHYSEHGQRRLISAETHGAAPALLRCVPCHAAALVWFFFFFFLQHTTSTACGSSSQTRRTRRPLPSPGPTHILDSLDAAPPVTLATRSCDSSTFRSSNCFSSSSFFFPRRSRALILACGRRTGRQYPPYPPQHPGPASPPPSAPQRECTGPGPGAVWTAGTPGAGGTGGMPGLPAPDAHGSRVRDAIGSRVPVPRDAGGLRPGSLTMAGGARSGAEGRKRRRDGGGAAAGLYQRAPGGRRSLRAARPPREARWSRPRR